MTSKAIDLLSSSRHGARNGFFLQVESASIDKRAHGRDACGQIGETAQLDDAVKVALDFAKKKGDTLVIVTADHAHAGQIVGGASAGNDVRLRTADDRDMIIAYATRDGDGSERHTGATAPVAGYGPGAANISGLVDQTDLFFIMRDGMNAHRR